MLMGFEFFKYRLYNLYAGTGHSSLDQDLPCVHPLVHVAVPLLRPGLGLQPKVELAPLSDVDRVQRRAHTPLRMRRSLLWLPALRQL